MASGDETKQGGCRQVVGELRAQPGSRTSAAALCVHIYHQCMRYGHASGRVGKCQHSVQFPTPSLYVCRMLMRPRLRGMLMARGQSIVVLSMTWSSLAMRCQGTVKAPTHPTATPQAVTVRFALAQSAAHAQSSRGVWGICTPVSACCYFQDQHTAY